MIEQLIYFSPLFILLFGIMTFMCNRSQENEPLQCFRLARILLALSFLMCVIFFNKPLLAGITIGSRFTLINNSLMYLGAFILMFFSRRWFLSMKMNANAFCIGVFITLLFGSLLIASVHLLLTVVCLAALVINNACMLQYTQSKNRADGKIILFSVIMALLLLIGGTLPFYVDGFSLFYEELRLSIEHHQNDVALFASVAAILVIFMLYIGLAPLHHGMTELLGSVTLPVFTFFILVPSIAGIAGLINLNIYVLVPLLSKLKLFYAGVALISIGIGAVGACSCKNIRKILAYAAIYHLGIVFLILQRFSLSSTVAAYVYYVIYLLTMYGVCAVLFGFKIKGEYPLMLSDFNGAAYRRPYISAMLVIFLFSLLGFPPTLGFLGHFSLFTDLVIHNHFYQMTFLLLMMLALAYSYLTIIQALYFEDSHDVFDRAERSIYVVIFANAILMALLLLQPQYLFDVLTNIIGDLFA